MEEKKRKDGRGGARPGAGRKPLGSKMFGFKASGDLAKKLSAMTDRSEFIKKCIVKGMETAKQMEQDAELEKHLVKLPEIMMPVFDNAKVAAGEPIGGGDFTFDRQDVAHLLCPHTEACYVVEVIGDSMIDAGIQAGDRLIIDATNTHPTRDEAALCELNGEYTVKFFERDEDGGWMYPANKDPKYHPIRVRQTDVFRIVGTVSSYIGYPKRRNKIKDCEDEKHV